MGTRTRTSSVPLALALVAVVIAVTSSAWAAAPVGQGNTPQNSPAGGSSKVTNAQLLAKLDAIGKRLDKLSTRITNTQKADKRYYQALAQQGKTAATRHLDTLQAIVQSCQKANEDARENYSASTSAPWLDIGQCPRIAATTKPAP
jgi:hypothetical protein